MVKRTLVTLSHVIEQAALAVEDDGPLVVVSLFQRLPYFHRERDVYRAIASHAQAVVAGFVDDHRPGLPGWIHPVLLEPDEPLAREWTVVVLSRSTGICLVAHDEEKVSPVERTLEAGRLFSARWAVDRTVARDELSRLRPHIADRIPPAALKAIDTVLGLPAGTGGGRRVTAALNALAERLETERRRSAALREQIDATTRNEEHDLASGLPNMAFLGRWAGTSYAGGYAPLPLGLVFLSLEGLSAALHRDGAGASRQKLIAIAGTLTERLGPADRAVRVSDDEFLLVAPGSGLDHVCSLAQEIDASLAGLRTGYPFLPVRPTLAAMVSRDRPLPLDALRSAAAWARSQGVPVAAYQS